MKLERIEAEPAAPKPGAARARLAAPGAGPMGVENLHIIARERDLHSGGTLVHLPTR
jgi:hypothetical protein